MGWCGLGGTGSFEPHGLWRADPAGYSCWRGGSRHPVLLLVSVMRRQTAGNRPYQHLYGRKAWPRIRARQLIKEPLCRMCKAEGRIVPAEIADHVVPHKGDWHTFFDAENLQSLCRPCHDSVKQRMEAGTFQPVGSDGWPVDLES